ncbi:MAG: hypothetical protein QOK37_1091 [Thermoanaerobaculia bacterium]|jgi:hypothetical protein|nr:hypothetical protein [Thermoanaerobaculia bacterium]
MPVRKFRSIEEMNAFDLKQMRRDDPNLVRRIEAHWSTWRNLVPPLNTPKGVHKFRSIEEMHAFKERYRDERIARIRAERMKK